MHRINRTGWTMDDIIDRICFLSFRRKSDLWVMSADATKLRNDLLDGNVKSLNVNLFVADVGSSYVSSIVDDGNGSYSIILRCIYYDSISGEMEMVDITDKIDEIALRMKIYEL